MQSVSSRIWTRIAVLISYDDNYYTTGMQDETRSISSRSLQWGDMMLKRSETLNKYKNSTKDVSNLNLKIYIAKKKK